MATKTFSNLPVLEFAKTQMSHVPNPLDKYYVVCIQHLLETTGSLIQALIDLGCEPQKLHILGKIYSANESVVERLKTLGVRVHHSGGNFKWGAYSEHLATEARAMWKTVQVESSPGDHIVILDDGGVGLETMPDAIALTRSVNAVEQTMSGIARHGGRPPSVPVIEVASSAAKTLLEPRLIREAVLNRVASRGVLREKRTVGVVGAGNIGAAVAKALIGHAQVVHVYDIDLMTTLALKGVVVSNSLAELVESVDVVWGCTGVDLFATDQSWRNIKGDKIFISCSSQDHEFRSILATLDARPEFEVNDRRSDITIPLRDGSIKLVNGGFPVNFDGSPESVPGPDIQLTRALLLCGVLQAAQDWDGCLSNRIMLNPDMQIAIVKKWLDERRQNATLYDNEITSGFDSERWVIAHSGGSCQRPVHREGLTPQNVLQAEHQRS
ncbi:MAG: hypothetical protein HY010_12725 [Acidobacteria bacterium]|nr:hypothetical protein [Acidobacteriota bacterium]